MVGGLAHWSSSGWSTVPSPRSDRAVIRRFEAGPSGDLWAVADGPGTESVIEHWDGRRWRDVPTPRWPTGAEAGFDDLAVVSEREVWAAGWILLPGARQAALLMRWDGDRWTLVRDVPPGAVRLGPLLADGHGGLWLGGHNYDYGDDRILLHYDGRSSWTYDPAPRTNNAPAVIDLVRVPGEDRVFAAGGNPSYDEDSQGWLWTRK
ncbi:hypothetical protein DI270_017145 [Microbispora triticiradicis]|uniref:Uncharacterized protein n=2 Tax=Microbispora triticiradicis TaxID=2200763 RepID=A0ABX9LIM8_9ACTN|nr:hypothetical protein DI270_017145 [Microbispora triticiradicis]